MIAFCKSREKKYIDIDDLMNVKNLRPVKTKNKKKEE